MKLAEASGIPGFRAETKEQAREALKKANKMKGPVLVELVVAMEENVFPMVAQGDSLGETRTQ